MILLAANLVFPNNIQQNIITIYANQTSKSRDNLNVEVFVCLMQIPLLHHWTHHVEYIMIARTRCIHMCTRINLIKVLASFKHIKEVLFSLSSSINHIIRTRRYATNYKDFVLEVVGNNHLLTYIIILIPFIKTCSFLTNFTVTQKIEYQKFSN